MEVSGGVFLSRERESGGWGGGREEEKRKRGRKCGTVLYRGLGGGKRSRRVGMRGVEAVRRGKRTNRSRGLSTGEGKEDVEWAVYRVRENEGNKRSGRGEW